MANLGNYFAADSIKVTATLSGAVTSATLTVCDSAGVEQVSAVSMNADTSTSYSYSFQTTTSWPTGQTWVKVNVSTATDDNVQEDYVMLNSLNC